MRPEDKLGLTLFADSAEIIEDLGASRNQVRTAIEKFAANGGTARTTRWPSRSSGSTRSTAGA